MDRRQNRSSRSAQDSSARSAQNSLEAEHASAFTWSTEHGGAGAMLSNSSRYAPSSGAALFGEGTDRQNPCSVLWPGTASSSPQETGFDSTLLNSSASSNLSPAAYTENFFFMSNDDMTIDPRNLMVNVYGSQALFHNQPERENRNLVLSVGTVVGDDTMTPISPIRRRLETLELPEAPSADVAPSSSAGTSYSGQNAAQESPFDPVDDPYQGSVEAYQQLYLETRPQIPFDPDLHGTTPDLFSSSDVANQRMPGGHLTSLNAMQYHDLQGRESNVYSESLAGPSGLVIVGDRTAHRMNESIVEPISSASPQVPYDSTTAALQSSNFPQMSRNQLRPIAPRPASFVQSTGHGPVIHSYEPEFAGARSQHVQNNAGFSGAASGSVAVGLGGQYIEQERPNDKGKGRLVLHDEKSLLSRPGKKSSSSSRKKVSQQGEGVIRRNASGSNRTIQPAGPTRPTDIECPFCKDIFSNHKGTIEEHVNNCRSPEVQAIRDFCASGNRGGMEPPARIRCPSCWGRREFKKPNRWSDHLWQAHGEWITYECDEEGCKKRFRTAKERNAHGKREHKH